MSDRVAEEAVTIAMTPAQDRALAQGIIEAADNERLRKAIIRQAGAAKTMRECTLAEVQHLKDMDRSEYHAAASLDSERNANKVLDDENDKLRADNERLRAALVEIAHTFTERSDGTMKSCSASFYQEVAQAALAQKEGK